MKRTKQLLSLLLAALLGLTACHAGGEREIHKIDWVTSPAYAAEDIALPVETGDLIGCCTDGEAMYILADKKTEDGEIHTVLCRVNLADGTVTGMEDYLSTDPPEDAIINRLGPVLSPDGSLWLYEVWTIMHYDLPDDFDPEKEADSKYFTGQDDFHHLRQLDPATGREKKLIDLSDAVRTLDILNVFDVAGFTVDGKGNICFAGTGGVAVLNKNGEHLFTLEADLPHNIFDGTSGGTLALLPDGAAAVLTIQPGGKRVVRTIDPAAKGWGADQYELPAGVDLIYGGSNGFLFYYTRGGALWAWEPEGKEGRLLLNWSAADLSGSVMCFAPRDGGKLAVLTLTQNGTFGDGDYWYNRDIRLAMLSPSGKGPADGKIRLVYGTIGTNSVQRLRINKFNSSNDEYYIELRNYAGDGVETYEADREAAQKLLSAEIASGRAPDIWDTSLPIDLYARKGMLEDLWPYIDGDPEISRDALMSHVLDCASVNGELYSVFNSFTIATAAARSELVGDRTSWTLDEVLEYYADMPEGSTICGYYHGRTGTLYYLIRSDLDRWIDWTTGECRFDSEEFKALLTLCAGLEDDTTSDMDMEKWNNLASGADLRAGRQLILTGSLRSPADLLYYDAKMGGPECLMDYEAYLNENNIFASPVDENGNLREGDALTCRLLGRAETYKEQGEVDGSWPLASDAVFGAVEGGGYAAYIGTPSGGGTGSCFVLPQRYEDVNARLGISAFCQAKEGAWAYVRQCLLPGGAGSVRVNGMTYTGSGFPICREDFDRLFEPRWFRYENGEYALDQDGNRIEEPQDLSCGIYYMDVEVSMMLYQLAPNEIQMERFWDLYHAIDRVESSNSNIMRIIEEQAEIYFAGDKSLDETVDLIQRRAELYVNENR